MPEPTPSGTVRRPARGDLPSRIVGWLDANDGWHRPRDIALGLGIPPDTQPHKWSLKVNRALTRMASAGDVVRRPLDSRNPRAGGLYARQGTRP